MRKPISKYFSYYCYRNLRYLFSLYTGNFNPPSQITQDIFFSSMHQIENVIFKQLHIKDGKLFIRCKNTGFQRNRFHASEQHFACICKMFGGN